MSIATLETVAPDTFDSIISHWTAEDFTIRSTERADCCRMAQAVVLTKVNVDGTDVPMRYCGHHASEYERKGLNFGEIVVDNRASLSVKPGASA